MTRQAFVLGAVMVVTVAICVVMVTAIASAAARVLDVLLQILRW